MDCSVKMRKVLVSPVAFNEHVKLKNAIQRFLQSRAVGKVEYLIIDDASTDDTTKIIHEFADKGVKTIKHEKRMGVGAAIRTAIKYAIANDYEILVIMAGNDKDNPEEIPDLLDPIFYEGYDLVQGSRYLKGGGIGGDMPFYRKVATKMHPALFSLLTHTKLTDSTNGFRAIKLSILADKRIDLEQDWLNAYELEPYLLYKAVTLGYKVKEAAVTKIYPPKNLGYTKMKPIVGWWSILRPLFYLGLGIRK